MNKKNDSTLVEGIRQWVEICLLQIEQKKLKEKQIAQPKAEQSNTELETLET